MSDTVPEPYCDLITFANYQNGVGIANVGANFQTCTLQIAPPVRILKFPNCFVVPAAALPSQPNINPM